MNSKTWIKGYFGLLSCVLTLITFLVVKVDPFFHYHAPNVSEYYYEINNQRSQNDGIIRHFSYDAIITGTSMTENFKTSLMDSLYGTSSVKVPFSGGSYKEINDNIARAVEYNSELKVVVRGLDMDRFSNDRNEMRDDMGTYPDYLYDDCIFNDVQYIFNRDVVFSRIYGILLSKYVEHKEPGITSFDSYSNWMRWNGFGKNYVFNDDTELDDFKAKNINLTDVQKRKIIVNIRQNVTDIPQNNSEITFYYFFPPYSILWWKDIIDDGHLTQQIEAERIVIEELLKYDNIKLYSFNTLSPLITNLNNYTDYAHYGEWVNDQILKWMKDDVFLITYDNYERYLKKEWDFYIGYDYNQLSDQTDYSDDSIMQSEWKEVVNDVSDYIP